MSFTARLRRLFVLAALLLPLACGGTEPPAGDQRGGEEGRAPSELRVTEKQDGASTGLQIGQFLRVDLPANPTTGYAWRLARIDDAVLRPPATEEYLPPSDDLPGAAGLSMWRFEAVAEGTGTLELVYERPFEEGEAPARTFGFTVVVGP